MTKQITTGPFIIPAVTSVGAPIDNLVIHLKNPETITNTVQVTVERCPIAFFPDTGVEEVLFDTSVTLNAHNCTTILVFNFQIFDAVRVTISGQVKSPQGDGCGIEAWVVTGLDGGPFEPTNLFRHSDFFELEEERCEE